MKFCPQRIDSEVVPVLGVDGRIQRAPSSRIRFCLIQCLSLSRELSFYEREREKVSVKMDGSHPTNSDALGGKQKIKLHSNSLYFRVYGIRRKRTRQTGGILFIFNSIYYLPTVHYY